MPILNVKFLSAAMLAASIHLAAARPLYADPPARVARISFVTGDASIRHGTSAEWMAFLINYPVTTGDELWTDAGSRAELHVGSTALRLGGGTALSVVLLEDDRFVLSLALGKLALRVRSLDPSDHMQIVTPTATIAVLRAGDYNIAVDSLGQTVIAVRSGDAEVATAGAVDHVISSHVGIVSSEPGAALETRVLSVEPIDEFDSWAGLRAHEEDVSEAGRFVSMQMTGYEALDGHGRWLDTPEYGAVWIPAEVGADWAPYRAGRWVWVDPWGWTWIDDQPWGFAPFHYGRWARYQNAWVWAPGERIARPVYAPALVGFVGATNWSAPAHFGGAGGVAWFPLAPGDPWVAPYHVTAQYARSVNPAYTHRAGIAAPGARYRNAQVAGAVTAVSRETFVGARPVRESAAALRTKDLQHVQVIAQAVPVTPRPESRTTTPGDHPAAPSPRVVTRMTEIRALPPADARAQADAVAQERAVAARQALEHARLEDKHQQERSSLAPGKTSPSMQTRHATETKSMEARHAKENSAPRAAPATSVAAKAPVR